MVHAGPQRNIGQKNSVHLESHVDWEVSHFALLLFIQQVNNKARKCMRMYDNINSTKHNRKYCLKKAWISLCSKKLTLHTA